MRTKSEELEAEVRFEAIHQGHAFIKLKLNPGAFRRPPKEYRMCGVKMVRGSKGSIDESGRPSIGIRIVGGDISFKFDTQDRDWIGWMLDDKDKGVSSPTGYNRDFIASHVAGIGWEKAVFHLDSRDEFTRSLKEDISSRIKRMEEVLKKKAAALAVKNTSSLSDIERSIAELTAKKASMLARSSSPAKEGAHIANNEATG